MFKNKTPKVTAKRLGKILVVAFDTAEPPLFWQFDLIQNHSFSLNVKQQNECWELGICLFEGKPATVASFALQSEADEALAVVEKALMSEDLLLKFTPGRRVVGLAIILLLGWIGWGLLPSKVSTNQLAAAAGSVLGNNSLSVPELNANPVGMLPMPNPVAPVSNHSGEIPSGVPVNADDVLQAPAGGQTNN